MKYLLSKLYLVLTAVFMMACSNEEVDAEPVDGGNQFIGSKTLIVYYSYTNHTEELVADLKGMINADVIEVEPEEKGLDYSANNYAIGTEQLTKIKNNPGVESSYPAIDPVDVDMSQYNTVIIATPLWWSQMASNMQTFLFKYGQEMDGKNIGLIVSSHSSGISGVEADAKRLVPNGKFMSKSLWINNANHSKRKSMLEQWLLDVDYTNLSATTNNTMYLKINNNIFTVDLESNSSAEALVDLLKEGDITYEAHDYGDFEKVGELGYTLPTNNKQITTEPGDVILYNGNNICIFYGSNSWSYTRLGKIRDINTDDLKKVLRNGDVAVTFTLANPTFASLTRANSSESKMIYSINGTKLSQVPEKGFYIENGVKKIK